MDANIFIDSWNDFYPIRRFPTLWAELPKYKQYMVLIKSVYDQIDLISATDKKMAQKEKDKKYPLRAWMVKNQLNSTAVDADVEKLSLSLEKKYEIREKGEGVDQVDITLIAYAKKNKKIVVTFEKKQTQLPKYRYRYRIPLICEEEQVRCINFIEFLDDFEVRI